ncbi:MAG TPA: hypothetical protein VGQ06_03320 [Gemmatimonadales bacterium]|jgi:hypothetical protein|nr:hypothetical protein [Gemmatimonadales bacterium]
MTRTTTRLLRRLLLLAGVGTAPALHAQDTCDAMIARASNEFDTARRLDLLTAAVNPATCPPRGAWTAGVQLLGQTLIEDGKDSVASVWLRWAIRLAPDMQPDTVQFLPRVIQAFRTARDFVDRTRVSEDSAVQTTWLWPTTTGQRDGRLQVASSTPPLRVDVTGMGTVPHGSTVPLAAGSYRIGATASGYDSVRVTREVLPGVTTVLRFNLGAAAQQLTELPRDTAQTPAAGARKKGLPTWVKLGAAGAIAWAIAWNAYIKSH